MAGSAEQTAAVGTHEHGAVNHLEADETLVVLRLRSVQTHSFSGAGHQSDSI